MNTGWIINFQWESREPTPSSEPIQQCTCSPGILVRGEPVQLQPVLRQSIPHGPCLF